MKHFASFLRKRGTARTANHEMTIVPSLLKHLNRKELISILIRKLGPKLPNDLNLRDLENEELLELIGDEMYILAFFADKWSKEPIEATPVTESLKTKVKSKRGNNKT